MRVMAAEPKAERFVRRHRLQKLGEPFEVRSGRVSRASARLEISRSPAFAGKADSVTSLFEQVRIHREFLGQETVQSGPFLQTMRRLSGQNGRMRGFMAIKSSR